jgi:hypothetical protein
MHDRTAEIMTKKVVVISEYLSPRGFTKYPNIEPRRGKKINR